MSTIQDRVKELLERKNVTPYRVSKETGISQSTLSRFLNCESSDIGMHPETIERISKYFEVSPSWLLSGEGEMLTSAPVEGDQSLGVNNGSVSHSFNRETAREMMSALEKSQALTATSQAQLSKAQEQIDRLISIIEKSVGE